MKRSIQREAILNELRSVTTHPTAEELYTRLKNAMPNLSLATVYRNLEQFSKAGIVHKLDCGGELKRFDGNILPHSHMRCHSCGSVSDMADARLKRLQDELLKLLPELDCRSLNIEFCGLCQSCRSTIHKEENAV